MGPFLMALVLLGAAASLSAGSQTHSIPDSGSESSAWLQFKQQFGKVYKSQEEDSMRFANFMAAKRRVELHNANQSATYKMGLNQMSDWTSEEFNRLLGSNRAPWDKSTTSQEDNLVPACWTHFATSSKAVPLNLDWRKVPGRVGPVKTQGLCGSCWAFSTTGLLEGQQLVLNISKTVIQLSEQQLLDCSEHSNKCDGGSTYLALIDIAKMGGIQSNADYEYAAVSGQCRLNTSRIVMRPAEPCKLDPYREDLMKLVVARYGPIVVSLNANPLLAYRSGILKIETCGEIANHEALIVGYGEDKRLGRYWLLKNSWGNKWGDKGYFKVERGTNMCSIALRPILALY